MASTALVPGPPAATPPAWTDDGSLHLLEILRLHVRGVPDWMLPRYIIAGVDFYDREPEQLLRNYPSATSADGKKAVYFLNSKNDSRISRVAPGGTWKPRREAVDIWGASGIAGTRQPLSFTIKDPEGGRPRPGFLAQEFALSGSAGRLAGGVQLVLTMLYLTPPEEEAVSQAKERVIANARRTKIAASSSRAPLPPPAAAASPKPAPRAATSPAPLKAWAPRVASTPAPPKRAALDFSTPAPPKRAALDSSSFAPPKMAAAEDSSPAPPKMASPDDSSPAPVDQAASARRPTPSTRWFLLEVADSPANQGDAFFVREIHRAAELVGSSLPLNMRKTLAFDCQNLFLVQEGTKKMFSSSP